MPGSEGKQLAGLARSIDALFSGAEDVSAARQRFVADPEPAPSVDPPQFGVLAAPDAVAPVDELGLVDAGGAMDGVEAAFGETATDELALAEPALDEMGLAEPALDEIADTDVDASLDLEATTVDDLAEAPDEPAAATDATSDDDDPGFDTTLDQAVQAFLDGDEARADEISALGDDFLERKDFEPIVRAVVSLVAAAGEPADDSIMAAAHPLMSQPVLARLARRLGSERDEEQRAQYYAICRSIGTPMAEAIRDDLADSTDRLARRIHCEALAEMGDSSRAVIDEMAVDENRFLVRNAVTILGELGGDRAIELITSALANPDARVRREALRALTKLGAEDTGQFVLGLLEDPDEDVRLAAAVAAGELQVERALKSLIAMLDGTKDPDKSITLIRALGHLGDPGAVASIEKHAVRTLFSKPRTDVRIAAYRALNQIGTPHARRLLNQAVSDKEAEVKAAVKEILHMR